MKIISSDKPDTIQSLSKIEKIEEEIEEPFNNPIVLCDNCGEPHTRERFCSNKCKDQYHNKTNPERLERALRYGYGYKPEEAEEFAKDYNPDDPMKDLHLHSSEALGQS